MSSDSDLPECGILPTDGSVDADEWHDAMLDRWESLIAETADILSEYTSALDAAVALNRLYAPFNVVDVSGGVTQHLVVTTGKYAGPGDDENIIHFQIYEERLDLEEPLDYRNLERRDDFWWFADAESPERDEPEMIHENVAASCLQLIWWGDEKMIARMRPDAMVEAQP